MPNKKSKEENKHFESIYEIERIITHCVRTINGVRTKFFLVRWKGYGPESDSWETESSFILPSTVRNYMKLYAKKELQRRRIAHGNKVKQVKSKIADCLRFYKNQKKFVEQTKRQNVIERKKTIDAQSQHINELNESNTGESCSSTKDFTDNEINMTEGQSNQTTSTGIKIGKRQYWKPVDILQMRKNYADEKEYLVRWQNGKTVSQSYHAWELEHDLKCKTLIRKYHSFKL